MLTPPLAIPVNPRTFGRRVVSLRGVASLFLCAFVFSANALAPQGSSQLPPKSPGRYLERMSSGGLNRQYVLRVPSAYNRSRPLPLVVLLHGWTGTAAAIESHTGFGDKAEREGFVLAVPEGLGRPQAWNVGFLDLTGNQHPNDAAFVADLIDQVKKEVGIDPNRVFVAGHSNGAMLAHLVGAKYGDRVAAIGVVAGTIGLPSSQLRVKSIPPAVRPVSVMILHGRKDGMVAYDSRAQALLMGIGAPRSAQWWAQADGCPGQPTLSVSPDHNVELTRYAGGRENTEVQLMTINNGIHDWPGGSNELGRERTTHISATDVLWDFFVKHPRRG